MNVNTERAGTDYCLLYCEQASSELNSLETEERLYFSVIIKGHNRKINTTAVETSVLELIDCCKDRKKVKS